MVRLVVQESVVVPDLLDDLVEVTVPEVWDLVVAEKLDLEY